MFGQSLSVNGVQMAAAINTIANGGVRIDPSLIQGSATMDDGTEVGTDTATRRRVISAEAARQTALMMERVIDSPVAVAPGAAVPGYRVAGKTGTAQRVGAECGCYDGTFTVSFAGFAPADDPRFTIYVVVQDPAERRRRLGGRPGVRQADELRAAPLPGAADQHAALAPARRMEMSEDHPVALAPDRPQHAEPDRARCAGRRARGAGGRLGRRRRGHRLHAELAPGPSRRPVRRPARAHAATASLSPQPPPRPERSPCSPTPTGPQPLATSGSRCRCSWSTPRARARADRGPDLRRPGPRRCG